jgi:hypothetical protein
VLTRELPVVNNWKLYATTARERRNNRIARIEMGAVAGFHLIVAVLLIAAPRERVITPGTSVIFGTFPIPVWFVWFALTGLAAATCVHSNTDLRQALTWIGAFPIGIGWIYGFGVAISQGRGNVLFALFYAFLLVWWATLAARLHFGETGTRWDRG